MSITSIVNDNIGDSSFVNAQKPIPPTISSYSVSGSDDNALDPAGGQTVLINGTGFMRGATATFDGSAIAVVSWVSSSQLSFTSPAKSAGTYTLYVVNPDGGTAIYIPGIIYSTLPSWTTGAGSLGSYYETTSISSQVVASGDAPITYSLYSGSLPVGSTLYANGVITGTAPVDSGSTTYSFTVQATDAQLQDSTRSFSLTINTDVVTWTNPPNGATIALDGAYSTVLTATDAAGYNISSFTANALPAGLTLSGNTISGTASIETTTTTLLTATAATTGRTATNTVTWVVQLGDLDWTYVTTLLSCQTPTPLPFNDDASTNNFAVTAAGDTRPNNYNPYTPGYYSFNFTAKTQYVSVPATTALTTYTGDFTLEAWVYPSDTSITFWGIWDSRNAGGAAQAMVFMIEPLASPVAGQGRMKYYNGTNYYSTGIVYYNRWTHVAYVRSGTTLTYYINGVASGTSTISGTQTGTATTNPIWIGTKDNASASYGTTGCISNFRIVNGTAVYTSNFTPSTTPLPVITNTVLLTAQDNSFIDESAANRILTPSSATISGFNPFATEYVKNTPYYSGYFDGTGDMLSVTSLPGPLTGDFTYECWAYPTSSSASYRVVFGIDNYGSGTPFRMYQNGTNFEFWYTGSLHIDATGIVINNWYHLAVTRSGGVIRFFVNGTQIGSNVTSTLNYPNSNFRIGMDSAGTYPFVGSISNVRAVNGTAVYTTTFTPPTTPLTAISGTSLLTCQSSTFIDNSTNNFTIAVSGDAKTIAAAPFTDTGYSSTVVSATYGSTYLDGTGDWLTVPYSSAFDTGTTYTIEAYVYPTILNAQNYIFNISNSNVSSFGGWLLWVNSSGSIYFECRPSTGGTNVQVIGGTVRLNAWSHVAVVVNSNAVKIFLNGSQVATGTVVALNGTQTNVGIGALTNGATANPWNGYISNVRLVKGTAVYTTPFIPPTEPLTSISGTSLLTCQYNQSFNNNVFLDSSTNNFLVTRNGNTAQGTVSPYGENWSNYFDGTGDYLTLPNNQAAFSMGTGDFTIEMWIYVTSLSSARTLYDTMNAGDTTGTGRFALQLSTGGTVQIFTGAGSILTSGGTVSISTWYHLAITKASNSTRIFLNGTQVNSTYTDNNNYIVGTTARPIIGVNGYDNSTNPMFGYISNLRVVKGTALYTSSFTPSTTPLQAIVGTSLLTCQSPGLVDDSPNNFAITKTGDVSVQKFGPFAGTTLPTPYYSGYFDGSGDYLLIPQNTAFAFPGDFTIEAWVYLNTVSGSQGIYSSIDSSGDNWVGVTLLFNGTSFQATSWTPNNDTITHQTAVSAGQWYHIAIVRNGSTTKSYLNGVQSTGTTPGTYSLTQSGGSIGTAYPGTSPLNGYISNLRVVKGTAVYTANFTPPTSPLTAISGTSLLACQSSTFIDNSTNNFAITVAGNSQPTMVTPFTLTYSTKQSYTPAVYGGSMYFDGTGDYLTVIGNSALALGAGDFTIDGWFYGANLGTWRALVLIGTAADNGIYLNTSNQLTWFQGGVNASSATVTANAWNHFAVTRQGTTLRVFLNGVKSATDYTTSTNYTRTSVNIGANAQTTPGEFFTGYLSNIRVINGNALYTSNFAPPNAPSGAVANTTLLLNGTGAGMYDASEMNDVETVGDAKISTTVVKYGNTSMYFDGNGDRLVIPYTPALSQTGPYTVEFWFYPTYNYTAQYLYARNAGGYFCIAWNGTTGRLSVDKHGVGTQITGTTTLALNQWYHVAMTYDGTTTRLFASGVLQGSVSGTGGEASAATTIAYYEANASSSYGGNMSDFRFTRGKARYTANFTPPSSPFPIK